MSERLALPRRANSQAAPIVWNRRASIRTMLSQAPILLSQESTASGPRFRSRGGSSSFGNDVSVLKRVLPVTKVFGHQSGLHAKSRSIWIVGVTLSQASRSRKKCLLATRRMKLSRYRSWANRSLRCSRYETRLSKGAHSWLIAVWHLALQVSAYEAGSRINILVPRDSGEDVKQDSLPRWV